MPSPRAVNAPEAGDVVWIDFGPPVGHEQAGRRLALVLSAADYNSESSLVIVCPVTRNPRPWPFKVPLPAVGRLQGFVIVDQVRAVDRSVRVLRYHGRAPDATLAAVYAMLGIVMGRV